MDFFFIIIIFLDPIELKLQVFKNFWIRILFYLILLLYFKISFPHLLELPPGCLTLIEYMSVQVLLCAGKDIPELGLGNFIPCTTLFAYTVYIEA